MNKIQLIEEPLMAKMTMEETANTLGGWHCGKYMDPFNGGGACTEYYSSGPGACSGTNNYCGVYN